MSRVPDITAAEMSPLQEQLYHEISGPRGNVGGPFALWIRLPGVADAANKFGNALRLEGKLDKRVFELVILIVARYWNAQYEWYTHEAHALKFGLAPTIIAAIRLGTEPPYQSDDERVAAALTKELLETRTVSQATYDRTLAFFGLELLIELITVIGFYTTAAMMINTFDSAVPGDAKPLDVA
jgi:4-carboxymuconolactone decarboxylase